MLKNKNNLALVLLLLTGLCLACNVDKMINGDTDQANKLIDEGNEAVEKSNKLTIESNELLNKLLENSVKAEDIKKFQVENKSKFDKVIKLNEESIKLHNESNEIFEKAVRLDIDEKYKEYLQYKIKEFQKSVAVDNLHISFIEDFLKTQDVEKLNEISADFNKKGAELNKEIEEFQTKSAKIKKDNPEVWEN